MNTGRVFAIACSLLLVTTGLTAGCDGTDEAPPVEVNNDTADTGPNDADAGDDADEDPPEPAEINVDPDNITFDGVEIDETVTEKITIQNKGEKDLEIEDVTMEIDDDFAHDLEPADGEQWPEFPETIPGDQALEVSVDYTPREAGSTTGEITIESDDEDQPESVIRIETISAYPEIETPDRVTFGTVDPTDETTDNTETIDDIEVANRGKQLLEVDSIEIQSDDDDASAFSLDAVQGSNELPDNPDTLERHAFWYLEVTFAPETDERHTAEIVINSNDPANEERVIEMTGNRPEPCLSTSGNLDFEEMNNGQEMTRDISILNCSQTQDLEVSDIELVDDGGGVFERVDPAEEPVELGPAQTHGITIRATMSTEQEVVGLLTLSSNDPAADHVPHQLRARPSGN